MKSLCQKVARDVAAKVRVGEAQVIISVANYYLELYLGTDGNLAVCSGWACATGVPWGRFEDFDHRTTNSASAVLHTRRLVHPLSCASFSYIKITSLSAIHHRTSAPLTCRCHLVFEPRSNMSTALIATPIPDSQKLLTTVNRSVVEARVSTQLEGFRGLKTGIQTVTGQLPDSCKPLVGRLSVAYNNAWKGITVGLADASANASKYVVKVHALLRRGQLTERDERTLAALVPSEQYLRDLKTFVDGSCDLMQEVHVALMEKADGEKVQKLQSDAEIIQTRMEGKNNEIYGAAVRKGAAESAIARSTFEIEYVDLAITNKDEAKARMERELKTLHDAVPALNKDVMDHRDTTSTNYLDLGIIKIKAGSERHDNGERIAQAALERHLSSIHQLKLEINTVSTEDLAQRKQRALSEKKEAEAALDAAKTELDRLQKEYEADALELGTKRTEIRGLYERAGVSNTEVMKQVKTIANAAIEAYTSLHTSHGALRTDVGLLSNDPDYFVRATMSALRVMSYGDELFHTSALQDTQTALQIEA